MDSLSMSLRALADPTRRAILARLVESEASAGDLAARFAITPQAISRHLKTLEQAGLISRSRAAQVRPSKLEPRQLREVDNWLGRYRRFWEGALDKMRNYLDGLQAYAERHF